MAANRSNGNKTASALATASIVVSVAREAVDGVPVAKQIVGVVARIISLAEKTDRDREALHALSEKSLELARTVQNVLQGRTADDAVLSSLEKMHGVVKAVEQLMSSHIAKSRLGRAVGYALTLAPRVDRMSRELSDVLQEFNIVTLLDTNLRVRTVNQAVEDNARYDGEFRLLRDCDVNKGDLFLEQSSIDGALVVKYHRAVVDGRVFAVRYFAAAPQTSGAGTVDAEASELYTRITAHDRMLIDISTVQQSHSNVARVYGWSRGSPHNRFVVLKSGFIPASNRFRDIGSHSIRPAEILAFIFKLVDASRHLMSIGLAWYPELGGQADVLLDQHGEPTIGLNDDLRASVDIAPGEAYLRQLSSIFLNHFPHGFFEPSQPPENYCRSACTNNHLMDRLLSIPARTETQYWAVPRSDLPKHLLNGHENASYLLNAEAEIVDYPLFDDMDPWIRIAAMLPNTSCSNPRLTSNAYCKPHGGRQSVSVSVVEILEDESGAVFVHHTPDCRGVTFREIMDRCGTAIAYIDKVAYFRHFITTNVPDGVPGTTAYKPIRVSGVLA